LKINVLLFGQNESLLSRLAGITSLLDVAGVCLHARGWTDNVRSAHMGIVFSKLILSTFLLVGSFCNDSRQLYVPTAEHRSFILFVLQKGDW
jgi:hypothetical protein